MEPTTDLTFLTSFTGGNQDKMKKYISMFLASCPNQISTMRNHLESENYDGLRATAHALKPQITYMGIKSGIDLIKSIEDVAGSKSNVEKLPELLGNFSSICETAMVELQEKIA